MTRLSVLVGAVVLALSTSLGTVGAGSYSHVAECGASGCVAGVPKSNPNENVPPFAIVHPLGYERQGGQFEIPGCVSSNFPSLIGPTQRAIATWNALVATTQNCLGCALWEGSSSTGDTFHAESVILHELGHCALGLDHPDRPWDADNDGFFEPTSFTRSWCALHPGGIIAEPPPPLPSSEPDGEVPVEKAR